MSRRLCQLGLAAVLGAAAASAQGVAKKPVLQQTVKGRSLPVHAVRSDTGSWLALLISGDGGWVAVDQQLSDSLAARGVAVAGLDARSYLRSPSSPAKAAVDAEAILRDYGSRWSRQRIVLIGYSRGADMMPFIANRLHDDVRRRVEAVVLIGLADRASFEFHWADLVRDPRRPTDLPVLPEMERLRGMPMLCVYGDDEHDSLCHALDPTLAQSAEHGGKHRIKGSDAAELTRYIMGILPVAGATK